MNSTEDKVMSAKEAIRRFVHSGDHLIIGNYTVGTCTELVGEVARASASVADDRGWTLIRSVPKSHTA